MGAIFLNKIFLGYHFQLWILQEDDEAIKKLDKKSSRSKLPKAVQDLVCLIFDVESMKKAMMEFEVCFLFWILKCGVDWSTELNKVHVLIPLYIFLDWFEKDATG